jgi:hypothetical protein
METNTTTPGTDNYYTYQNIDAYLSSCETALINAQLPEIAPLLTARGYTPPIITAKMAELAIAKQLVANQLKEYGEQYASTQEYINTVQLLHPDYMDTLTLARVALRKDVAAQTALGLKGERNQSESSYCSQALLLYNGLLTNPSYKTAIGAKGVTEAQLLAGKAGYESLTLKIAKKANETGEAQEATAMRNEAIDNFAEWFTDFRNVAFVALRTQPQLREKMGWKE